MVFLQAGESIYYLEPLTIYTFILRREKYIPAGWLESTKGPEIEIESQEKPDIYTHVFFPVRHLFTEWRILKWRQTEIGLLKLIEIKVWVDFYMKILPAYSP